MVLAYNEEKIAGFLKYQHTSKMCCNLLTKLLCIVGYYGDRFVAAAGAGAGGVDDDGDV